MGAQHQGMEMWAQGGLGIRRSDLRKDSLIHQASAVGLGKGVIDRTVPSFSEPHGAGSRGGGVGNNNLRLNFPPSCS